MLSLQSTFPEFNFQEDNCNALDQLYTKLKGEIHNLKRNFTIVPKIQNALDNNISIQVIPNYHKYANTDMLYINISVKF